MENMLNLFFRRVDKIILTSYIIAIIILILSFIGGFNTEDDFVKTEITYTFTSILFNNLSVSILFFLGIFSFGAINIGLAILNGFTIGSIFSYGVTHLGIWDSLLKIIPHGIFEIPSIIISISVGFIPMLLIIKRSKTNEKIKIGYYMKYICFALLMVILLNILSAFIEVYITMKL
jgi:stage II sporulation protein M